MGNYCANTNIWIDMMRSIDKNMKTVIGNHKIDFCTFGTFYNMLAQYV